MIGLHRQFVSSASACWRLPELGLLAGNMLTHIAMMIEPTPTRYWDTNPKRTPGRLRRVLSAYNWHAVQEIHAFSPKIRAKASKTDQLPK